MPPTHAQGAAQTDLSFWLRERAAIGGAGSASPFSTNGRAGIIRSRGWSGWLWRGSESKFASALARQLGGVKNFVYLSPNDEIIMYNENCLRHLAFANGSMGLPVKDISISSYSQFPLGGMRWPGSYVILLRPASFRG